MYETACNCLVKIIADCEFMLFSILFYPCFHLWPGFLKTGSWEPVLYGLHYFSLLQPSQMQA